MATSSIKLPEGFVLDAQPSNLPEGFVLDSSIKSPQPSGKMTWAGVKAALPEVVNQVFPYKAIGRGIVKGATFGMKGGTGLEGSVISPDTGKPKTTQEKVGEFAGQFAGTVPWLAASEGIAGASIPGLVAKYAISPFGQAVARGAGTIGTYEAMKGGIRGQEPTETFKDIGLGAAGGAVMGAGGYGLGKAREFMGDYIPRKETNYFLGTSQKIAEKLQEQGKLPLSEQLLQKEPKLQGFKTRQEVRDAALNELGKENYYTNSKLQEYANQAVSQKSSYSQGKLGEPVRVSDTSFSPQAKVVNLHDIVDSKVNSLASAYEETGNASKARAVLSWGEKFKQANPKTANLIEGNNVRVGLDNEVGKAYLSNSEAKLSPIIDAQMGVANEIRQNISEQAPEVASSLTRQHRLLNIVSSLSPQTAETGKMGALGYLRTPITAFAGSKYNYGMAQGLRNTLGTPSKYVSPFAKKAGQIGLSKSIDKYK